MTQAIRVDDQAQRNRTGDTFSAQNTQDLLMGGPAQALTPLQQLLDFMRQFDVRLQVLRTGLGSISGSPRVNELIKLQTVLQLRLEQLNVNFWNQDPPTRAAALTAYLSAARTAKWVIDDVYIEALEEATPDDQAIAKMTGAQIETARKLQDTISATYQSTIEAWIVGSPLIDPKTRVGNNVFLPKVTNGADSVFGRGLEARSAEFAIQRSGKTTPIDSARNAIKAELPRIAAVKKVEDARLDPQAMHLVGIVFLLAQLELKERAALDSTRQTDVDDWYEAALRPVRVMATEVIGVFDAAFRAAIAGGRFAEAERLQSARQIMIVDLATLFSFRRQETEVLKTFFDRENAGASRFSTQDTVIGVNKVTEILSTYPGMPNPDNQGGGGHTALSVESVRLRSAELVKKDSVKVFGLINQSLSLLTDERTRQTLRVVDVEKIAGLLRAVGRDRRVVIDGKLTGTGATLTLESKTVKFHQEGYRAFVGFPLEFAQQAPVQPNSPIMKLEQAPDWRRSTPLLQRAFQREREDQRLDGVFSVAQTLAGQPEFVTGLIEDADVRKAFAASLQKSLDFDLQDRETRVQIFSTLFKRFAQRTNPEAIALLNAYIQAYLTLYTKHTFFNLRDDGPAYLDSNWPTDLTNRKMYDCGVYAVLTAYDLYRAVQGTSALTLEFRFLTFLNHICLVVCFDRSTFLVNNATITAPIDVERHGTLAEDRIHATFQWSREAYASVYNVDYSFFLALQIPTLTLDTNRSEPDFRRAIQQMYLGSQGWGIDNDPTIAGQYFEGISLFNKASKVLAAQVQQLKTTAAPASVWDDATTRALQLYALAEKMMDGKNFKFFNTDLPKRMAVKVGFGIRGVRDPQGARSRKAPRSQDQPTLPMYELGELLIKRGRTITLTADQDALTKKKRGDEHTQELTDRL
jgi:hypothetical protein